MDFFRRAFAGKVVLFGSTLDFEDDKLTSKRFAVAPPTTAPERCALPASGSAPVVRSAIDGVYVHATAVNNLMRGEGIAEIGDGWRWLVVIIGALAGAFAAFFMTPLKAASSLLIAAIVWIVIATVAFKGAFALPLLEPLAAAVASLIATTGFRLFVVDRDKRFLRRAFELYLAPAVIEKMLASNKPPVLGGEMRAVTLFFSDIVGFSSFSEAMQPADLVLLMNRYLSVMTDAIEKHGGFVDKYIGDAIVAMFGAPAESVDHAAQAVRAALACQRELEALNRDAAPRLAHRIGLNSGRALVGNIGSRRRFNYTVMGDTVNLASRLEGANKYFGTSILASGATVALTGEAFAWREIDTIRVKGRGEAVRIYEPLGEAGRQSADQTTRAASYAQGLQHWRGGDFAAAAEAFAECADSDKPSALFLARARKLLASHPVAHWEPVQTLDEK
jgi:adenylate cyclase